MRKAPRKSRNSFVLKILTSNSFAFTILRDTFCKTRASQAFQRGGGEGGYPRALEFPETDLA